MARGPRRSNRATKQAKKAGMVPDVKRHNHEKALATAPPPPAPPRSRPHAEVCVANGVAVWNKDFDYKDEESEMVYITHPALLMSFDETGFDLDQGEDTTRGIHVKERTGRLNDNGTEEIVVNRITKVTHSSLRVTGVGGSTADGNTRHQRV